MGMLALSAVGIELLLNGFALLMQGIAAGKFHALES